ncbi:hypothetical protein JCM8547_007797 [Rhodosporidiobolus lusitaniae]
MSTPKDEQEDISLAQLLTRAIRNSDAVCSAPSPNSPATQSLLTKTLSDLTLASKLINYLAVLSPNETLEDIATRDLRCLLVEALRGQLSVLVKTKGGEERLGWLKKAQDHFRLYLKQIEQYEIVPQQQRLTLAGPKHSETDPSRRRAGKIAQFKMEKEIKGTLDELRTRRRKMHIRSTAPSASSSSSTTSQPQEQEEDDFAFLSDDDDQADDIARPLLVSLLTLHYLRAHSELSSIEQEVELLEHGMRMSDLPSGPSGGRGKEGRMLEFMNAVGRGTGEEDVRQKEREGGEGEEAMWRLDKLKLEDEPVLSPNGKVLRPFTILPSSSSSSSSGGLSTRLRLQSEVFRPSHRLPTMTIDEFLQQEQEMGNVLQGGGERTTEEVEEARREDRAKQEEDNRQGYEDEEGGLRKKREWDDWKDTHRKGEGNINLKAMQVTSDSLPPSPSRRPSPPTSSSPPSAIKLTSSSSASLAAPASLPTMHRSLTAPQPQSSSSTEPRLASSHSPPARASASSPSSSSPSSRIFTILVGLNPPTSFSLTLSQIESDSPSLFTSFFLSSSSAEESEAEPLRLPSFDPDLFRLIVLHLSGYLILPLASSAFPPTMSPGAGLRNLLHDASRLSLSRLYSKLVRVLNNPLEMEDLKSGLVKLDAGREGPGRGGWWKVVVKGSGNGGGKGGRGGREEEALMRLKNVTVGITPDPTGDLTLHLFGTPLLSFLPVFTSTSSSSRHASHNNGGSSRPQTLRCTIPSDLLPSTGLYLSPFGHVPAQKLYVALSLSSDDFSPSLSSRTSIAPISEEQAVLLKRLEPSRPPSSAGPSAPHTFIATDLVLRLKIRSLISSAQMPTRSSTPRRPGSVAEGGGGAGEPSEVELVFVSCRLETPERFEYGFSKSGGREKQ